MLLCAFFTPPLLLLFAAPGRGQFTTGRTDGMFAGTITERFVPTQFTIATTEQSTFGLMIERPVVDLWGYSNPAIAFSKTCSGDRNPVKPPVFPPADA